MSSISFSPGIQNSSVNGFRSFYCGCMLYAGFVAYHIFFLFSCNISGIFAIFVGHLGLIYVRLFDTTATHMCYYRNRIPMTTQYLRCTVMCSVFPHLPRLSCRQIRHVRLHHAQCEWRWTAVRNLFYLEGVTSIQDELGLACDVGEKGNTYGGFGGEA